MTARETHQQDSIWARFAAAAGRFASDCSGATAIEYGLLVAIIAAAVIAGTSLLGGTMNNIFARISSAILS